ncbi:MAG: response regulator [Ignavibacteria bacterium]|nr:response regulator [Ignavibacteria bacterium]
MKKILAIDDNPANLELIFTILNADFPDCQILLSQSGSEGIEIAKRELPDTILLDILMPGMDGFEVCDILKHNTITQHIPIIMVSAMNELSSRIKGLNTGADAYISKPFRREELKAQVNVMLRIKFAEDMLRNRNEKLEILIKKQTAEFDSIEHRYLKVSEYALEYFWEVDQNGQFTYVSPVIVRILGHSPDEITGEKSLFDFCSYNENTKSKEFLATIFARRENFTGNEVLCSHKNGNKIWLTISGFPFFDGNNNFAGYIGVNHDVTRRKMAEAKKPTGSNWKKSMNIRKSSRTFIMNLPLPKKKREEK